MSLASESRKRSFLRRLVLALCAHGKMRPFGSQKPFSNRALGWSCLLTSIEKNVRLRLVNFLSVQNFPFRVWTPARSGRFAKGSKARRRARAHFLFLQVFFHCAVLQPHSQATGRRLKRPTVRRRLGVRVACSLRGGGERGNF